MNWYKKAKAIQIPPEIDQQIKALLPVVKETMSTIKQYKEDYKEKIADITFVDPYQNIQRSVSVFVSNFTLGRQAEYGEIVSAAYIGSGPERGMYIYRYNNELYNTLIHEMTHAIDPKTQRESWVYDEQNKYEYSARPSEFDAYSTELTNGISSILNNLKTKNDLNALRQAKSSLVEWLRSSNSKSILPQPFTNILDMFTLLDFLKNPKFHKMLKQRVYNVIQQF